MSIIVQRSFRVASADQTEFERMSAQELWPAVLQFGAKMVAYGTWAFGGRADEVTTHTAYESFDHWQATKENEDLRLASAERGDLVRTASARIIDVNDDASHLDVTHRDPDAPAVDPPPTFGRGSVISERTYDLSEGAAAEFTRLSQEHIWPWLEQRGARLVAYGHDPLGPSQEMITLFAFRSMSDWHRLSRPSTKLAPSPQLVEAWTHRDSLIRRHHGRLLLVGTDFGALL